MVVHVRLQLFWVEQAVLVSLPSWQLRMQGFLFVVISAVPTTGCATAEITEILNSLSSDEFHSSSSSCCNCFDSLLVNAESQMSYGCITLHLFLPVVGAVVASRPVCFHLFLTFISCAVQLRVVTAIYQELRTSFSYMPQQAGPYHATDL